MRAQGFAGALPLIAACTQALAAPQEAAVSMSALRACAGISTADERLACYDQLAARPAAPAETAPRVPARTAGAAAVPAGAAPAVPAVPAVPAASAAQNFGLYAAEHPAPPPATSKSLTLRVVGLGSSAGGRSTVALEGGQVWELEDADPLLADGDAVTIKRAALGSFLMSTPSGRTHRVRRLK